MRATFRNPYRLKVAGLPATFNRETPLWQWGAQSRADVLVFTTVILPYLVVKKPKAQQVLGDTIDKLGVNVANRILEMACTGLDSAVATG